MSRIHNCTYFSVLFVVERTVLAIPTILFYSNILPSLRSRQWHSSLAGSHMYRFGSNVSVPEDGRFETSNNYIGQGLPIRLVTRLVEGVGPTLKPVMEASKRNQWIMVIWIWKDPHQTHWSAFTIVKTLQQQLTPRVNFICLLGLMSTPYPRHWSNASLLCTSIRDEEAYVTV